MFAKNQLQLYVYMRQSCIITTNIDFFLNQIYTQGNWKYTIKVPVKAILQKISKHIINITYVLLKHYKDCELWSTEMWS